MTDADWLTLFAGIGSGVRSAVGPVAGTEAGRAELATGAGGDRTVEVDRVAESVAVAALEKAAQAGARFRLLSEEIGERDFGAESPTILLDPIDGSLNAKQGVPLYAIMLSLVGEPRVGGVRAGYVMNLATGEAWSAIRGGGAWRGGQRLEPLLWRPSRRFEVLALESSPRSLVKAEALVRRSAKVRILGSMAISIAQAAAGSFDVFCSPIDARVFDMTASLLVLKESGGVATDMQGRSLDQLGVDLETRSTLLCSADAHAHEQALEILL